MKLFLASRYGSVHALRGEHTCPTGQRAQHTVEVTPLQVLVYHLVACESCLPSRMEFDRIVQGRQR